jgi:hypothetical protein
MNEFFGQETIYNALTSSTTLSNLVSGRIYSYPVINAVYPYISLGRVSASPYNTHMGRGADTVHYISIFTKPGTLGYYPSKMISKEIDTLLDFRNLSYTSSEYMIAGSIKGVSNFEMQNEYIVGLMQYTLKIFEKQ